MRGIGQLQYAGNLDPVPADLAERATSSSAVSRRSVARSTGRLQAGLREGAPVRPQHLRADLARFLYLYLAIVLDVLSSFTG